MDIFVSVHSICLAENEGIMGVALISLLLITYLAWSNFKEKRERRRRDRVLEERRRAREPLRPQA
jgi:hypothetical protein